MEAIKCQVHGIKCDNKECSWRDDTAEFKPDYWLNKPCPECGSNLFTESAYEQYKIINRFIDGINKHLDETLSDEEKDIVDKSPTTVFEAVHDEDGLIDGLTERGNLQ